LELKYTTVASPIAGRISKSDVKRGNFVQKGTTLATAIDKQTIYANFTVSDRALLELMRANPEMKDRPNSPEEWAKVNVYLQRERGEEWVAGKLEYADQTGIDEATGTYGLRAEFPNDDGKLLPGLFVMLRLPIRRLEDAILVPERAVVRTQSGEFLLVVDGDNQVQRRPVVLGQVLDGWALVREGLAADETFVVDGLQRARPGAAVTPEAVTLSTEGSPLLQAPVDRQAD
jgi:RND family efflux transporter MFP subunit